MQIAIRGRCPRSPLHSYWFWHGAQTVRTLPRRTDAPQVYRTHSSLTSKPASTSVCLAPHTSTATGAHRVGDGIAQVARGLVLACEACWRVQ
eukprot:2409806-Lingulodinium_polyedra.AAC.1